MTGSLLSLSEAARRLGVHTSTLRRWADAGSIEVVLTPGGHRRFPEGEVDRMAETGKLAGPSSGRPSRLEDFALSRTRSEISHHDARWLHLSEDEREEKRMLGRRLMGLMMQFVAAPPDEGEDFLAEARAIGRIHAKSARRSGLELSEVLKATLFFRDNIVESAVLLPESAQARPDNRARLHRRLNAFLNEVQLAIAEVYQS